MTTAASAVQSPSFFDTPKGFWKSDTGDSNGGFSLHDLISIVNPLQHVPVISTLYQAVTGDKIGTVEQVAGDTLYGGLWGLVSSVANVAFKELTGKDFGDTVLAFAEHETGIGRGQEEQGNVGVAAAPSMLTNHVVPDTVAPPTIASVAPSLIVRTPTVIAQAAPATVPSPATHAPAQLQPTKLSTSSTEAATNALMSAMDKKGVDSALSQRAIAAYRKSLTTASSPADSIPTF